ncbi:MAG TPA: hypothetical protein VFS62_16730 [Chloroflexota bacterium]|nr:hypothetical protein [Chloroflexota bacterium]
MLRRLSLALAAAGIVVMAVGLPAQAAGLGGTINGVIVEKTAGATLQSGAKAYLYKLSDASEPSQAGQTDVDASGHFQFTFVETDPANNYEVGVQYEGAPYFSDKITFAAGETTRQLSLDVYEPGSDDSTLSMATTSLLIEPDTGNHDLVVLELNSIVNSSDRTFIPSTTPRNGGPPPLLRFSLPPNATDLTPGDGLTQDDVLQINTGFGAMIPIAPGSHDVGFTFRQAYQTSGSKFSLNVLYPTKSFRVLMPADGGQVSSPQLQRLQDQNIGGKQYRLLSATNLAPNTPISLSFSGLPGVSPLAELSQPEALPWLAAVLALVVLGLMFWYVRDRRRAAAKAKIPVEAIGRHELEIQRRDLLVALARLDDRHDAGQLAEEDYQSQRDVRKAELRDLIEQIEALGPA